VECNESVKCHVCMDVGDIRERGPVGPALRFVLLVAVVIFALAGCASAAKHHAATAGAAAPGTTTVHFHPYATGGHLTVGVGDVVRGQCWTTSIAAPSPNAYRCFQGNKILDPCFAAPHPANPLQLACLAAPWSRAVMLQVSGRLPAPASGTTVSRPWALQLSNGVRCVASTGTVPAVAGVNLTYHCADGADAALGGVSGSRLAAQYAPPGANALTNMTVTTVWDA